MQSIFIPLKDVSVKGGFGVFSFTRPHFFHMLTEAGVAAAFLRTVAYDTESAKAFVSKNSAVDLDAIQHILDDIPSPSLISLKKASTDIAWKVSTKSILLQNCILHLHMIEEPDQFGTWKIFGVDKEAR